VTRLGPGPEFDRIRAIEARLGERASGLGDDCALLPLGTEYLALSTDMSLEGVHFRTEWLSLEEIGWRAAAGALSDLAAVGAETVGVLAALSTPAAAPPDATVALMEGIGRATAAAGGTVLGGDLARGAAVTVAVTVIGRVARPVRRAGAVPGDRLWLTGKLGGARAGLLALEAGHQPDPAAREAFAHPVPRIEAGKWLAAHGARAMIDVSDGLAGDAAHLAAASGVSLAIPLERIPLGAGVADAARRRGEDPAEFAARGGEDYELLAALPAGFTTALAGEFERALGIPLTLVGEVQAGAGVALSRGGTSVTLTGFDHFAC
jgi:thiamine-monophosphate kinase